MDNTLGYEPGDVSSILAGGANQLTIRTSMSCFVFVGNTNE